MGACLITETVVYEPGFAGPGYVGGVAYVNDPYMMGGPVMANDPYMMNGPVMMNDPYMMGGVGMIPMQQEVFVQENVGINIIL
jgi:hypothetical protein